MDPSDTLLTLLIAGPAAAVVVAMIHIMWRERASSRETAVALVSAGVLVAWAVLTSVLALRGEYRPRTSGPPPIGIALIVALLGLALALSGSRSLRDLLGNPRSLLRLNVWRLLGFVFLLLMMQGRMPALWALPAGIGDILVGAAAFRVASGIDTPGGRRRAVMLNLLGMADLVVAVGLGTMTSPGPTQVFHTTPTSLLVTQFPLALVPTFLVPLAFANHVVSLRQLLGRPQAAQPG